MLGRQGMLIGMTNARQSLQAQSLTWNLEVMSKCFFMSVPSTWLIEQLRTGRRSLVNALSLCTWYSLSVPTSRSRCECFTALQSWLSLCTWYSLSVPMSRSRCECCSAARQGCTSAFGTVCRTLKADVSVAVHFQSQLCRGELARIICRPADLHQNVPRGMDS